MSHVELTDETQFPYLHNWSWEGDFWTLWVHHKYDSKKYGRVVLSREFIAAKSKYELLKAFAEEYSDLRNELEDR